MAALAAAGEAHGKLNAKNILDRTIASYLFLDKFLEQFMKTKGNGFFTLSVKIVKIQEIAKLEFVD